MVNLTNSLFFKIRLFTASFFFIYVFSTIDSKYVLTGFETLISGIGSNRFANLATITARKIVNILVFGRLQYRQSI